MMNNEERIERLLLALETALDIANEIWDYVDGGIPVSTHKQLKLLRDYAKQERKKQGTMTMSNEVIEENKKVGE